MAVVRNAALGAVAIVIGVAGVVGVRTAMVGNSEAQGSKLALPPAEPVDVEGAAKHLSQAVQIETVSHQDASENDPKAWDALHAFLAATYPKFHAAAQREELAGGSLIYTWKGSDAAAAPIILMAHQDVVPVAPETLGEWKAPPFSGAIKDGAVWGRGSIDDKGSLVALMEALESLAAKGFTPKRTIILVSGADEEVSGSGAQAAGALLKARGVHAEFALDEGSAVVMDMPLVGKPVTLIGVAEKGYATLRVTAKAAGGHSSAPPKDTGAVTLSRAVIAINDHAFPVKFQGPFAQMLKALAPQLPFVAKIAVANDWLFGPLVAAQASATPQGAAGLHTTTAPTMLQGSPKENVLPTTSIARINYRILPGDTTDTVMARAKSAVGKLPVELSFERMASNPSPVSSTGSEAYRTIAALAGEMSGAPVAPSLVTGATDSRHMIEVAKDVYRFQPIRFSMHDIEMIHGINEHMTLSNLEAMVQFYRRLVVKTAG
jgi:carboxypeptidase PM20D1